jgi:RNA polymerase sigma-70 factor (ECF subfamily)
VEIDLTFHEESGPDGPAPADRERELARRAGQGQREAFRSLVELYKDRMAQFVRWHASSDGDVDDAVSEIFLQAYRSIASYRGEAAFGTWLYALARNVCRHRMRHQRYRQSRETAMPENDDAALEIPDARLDHEGLLLTDESHRLVRAAVEGLPSLQRTVLHLREWEGLSYDEIAGVLDIPVGTVRSRLHNATALLMERLDPHFGISGKGGKS